MGIPHAWAASLPQPGKLTAFSVKETYTETTKSYREDGSVFTEIVPKSTTTIKLTAALGEVDGMSGAVLPLNLADIEPSTTFSILVGSFFWNGSLDEDPNIDKNFAKRAVFIPVNFDDETGKPVGKNGLRITWTSTKITFSITRALSDAEDRGTVYVDNLMGMAEPGGATLNVRDKIPVAFTFGAITSQDYYPDDGLNCFVKGTAKVTTKKVGSGDYVEEYDLNTLNITGALDTTPPTITVKPPKGGYVPVDGRVTVSGKVVDGHGITSLRYYDLLLEEEVEITDITLVKGAPEDAAEGWWGPTELAWEASVPIEPGASEVRIFAMDAGGNQRELQLKVFTDLPADYAGRWDALLNIGDLPGYVTVSCTSKGTLTGKITLEGGLNKSLKGFWQGSQFSIQVPVSKTTAMTVRGEIIEESEGSVESVRLSIEWELAFLATDVVISGGSGIAFRSPYSSASKMPADSPLLGRFNVKASPEEAPLSGSGWFSMVTGVTGIHKTAGKLADGTSFTASGIVGASGQMPFFVSLYKNQGSFSTAQEMLPEDGTVSPALAEWTRPEAFSDKQFPEGFTLELATSGARYTTPASKERILGLTDEEPGTTVQWSGNGVDGLVLLDVLVSNVNKITAAADPGFKAKADAKKGLVSGSFKLPTTPAVTATFSAIIIGNEAFGHYVAPALKGSTERHFGSFSIGPP